MAITPEHARRRFGVELRKWREHAGMSQPQLARSVPMSQSQISAIETGHKGTTLDQIRRFDQVLTTSGALVRRWENLQQDGRGFPSWFAGVVAVERQASEIREYAPLLVPGLLQTPEYAHASLRQGRPTDSEDQLDESVRARMERQSILTAERPPLLRAVIEEHVLRRPIGGRATMRAQLDQLLDVSTRPHVGVSVVPMSTETHPGQDGPFLLFTVPDQDVVAYTETRVSGAPTDDRDIVGGYVGVFGELCMVALPPEGSRRLIAAIRREFDDDQ
ncbi:helix-turn-helix domain-containing protein [Halostreptopolyspora alba]|uniref:XRE family transcriptional regulator n=1 Tax=Halostreptopolyspora alba TaxID=2487137 RepID=A0A3N0EII8_9ACTN|nr:XRE family transcriptional regulator [Nocardiopsaceae bacterium YIM 96095]